MGIHPYGVSVDTTGTRIYIANEGSDNVSVIDAASNAVVDTVGVGDGPVAFGIFIGGSAEPPGAVASIPTLTDWGTICLILLMSGVAWFAYRKNELPIFVK